MMIVNLILGQIQYTCKNILETKDSSLWNFTLMIMMTCLSYITPDWLLICIPTHFLLSSKRRENSTIKHEKNGEEKNAQKLATVSV